VLKYKKHGGANAQMGGLFLGAGYRLDHAAAFKVESVGRCTSALHSGTSSDR